LKAWRKDQYNIKNPSWGAVVLAISGNRYEWEKSYYLWWAFCIYNATGEKTYLIYKNDNN
ncbi:MAG: hypothetical protein WC290_03595, partial [archaeon]